MDWGYALLRYHPEIMFRSLQGHLTVKLVKVREISTFFSPFHPSSPTDQRLLWA